jgi:tetratricopeptide (TPR) repeat protein
MAPDDDDTEDLGVRRRNPDEAPTFDAAAEPVAGRYRILAWLGAGGMGSVYKVFDTELEEPVALKLLRRELVSDPAAIGRFRHEAKLARRVTHRNVARTYDIGEHRGERFMTMELVVGRSLRELIGQGPMPLDRLLAIGLDLCAALDAAHGAGVIHCDLKPDNVLISDGGRTVVTDFGVARALAGERPGHEGSGTPSYMAPEQVADPLSVDERTDVYGLGVLLYEMAAGAPARPARTPDDVLQQARWPAPDPREGRVDLPGPLGELIVECMQPEPDRRPPSAAAVAERLKAIAAAAKVQPATEQSSPERRVPGRGDLPEGVSDPVALELHLRARRKLKMLWGEGAREAARLLEQALVRDPDAPALLAGLAMARFRVWWYGEGTEVAEAARIAAERAVDRAGDLPESQLAFGLVRLNQGRPEDGVAALARAVALPPPLAEAREQLGRVLAEVGRVGEAVDLLAQVPGLDPSSAATAHTERARIHALLDEHDVAAEAFAAAEGAAREPQDKFVAFYRARLSLWRQDATTAVHYALAADQEGAPGLVARGLAAAAQHRRLDPELLTFFAYTEADRQAPRRRQLFFDQLHAELAAWCGRFDDALDALDHAAHHGLLDAFWLDRCPLLQPLGSSPRYQRLRTTVAQRADRVRPAYLRSR